MSKRIVELSYFGNTALDVSLPANTLPLNFIRTENIASIGLLIYSQYDVNVSLFWSSDGINTDLTDLHTGLATTGFHISTVVKSSYLGIFIEPASLPCILRVDTLFFFEKPSFDLTNLGAGVELYKEADKAVRSIICSDGSVTLSQLEDEIDVLVAAGASSKWTESGGLLEATTQPVNFLTGNSNNVIGASNINCQILGGENNIIWNSPDVVGKQIANIIVGGSGNDIFEPLASYSFGGIQQRNGIFSSLQSEIMHNYESSAIVGGRRNYLYSSPPYNYGIKYNTLVGGNDNYFDYTLSGNISPTSGVFNCVSSFMNGGDNAYMNSGFNSYVCELEFGASLQHTTFIGSRLRAKHSGVTMLGDGDESPFSETSSTAANEYSARFSGGYRLYSNATSGGTLGVSLAAGGNSWASISDVNKKENIELLDSKDVLNRFMNLPICQYNYKGCHKSMKCYGTMAQDFYSPECFPVETCIMEVKTLKPNAKPKEEFKPIEGETKEEQKIRCKEFYNCPRPEEDYNITYENCPAKDPLKLEVMDLIGVMQACIQELGKKNIELEQRLSILEKNFQV